MGISGLLPVLRNVIERGHVKKYAGQKVAIDTYCWLHKGCYGCAMELCTGAPTDKYINYCVDRVNMLLSHNITPVMVFDGANLPMKENTESGRKGSREEYRIKGQQALRADNRSLAFECFQRAVDVTPEMANRLIKVLQRKNIECIVAPYEADAQLAYLNIKGYVAAIISEDSDLIAFGARAVLFKMDKDGFVEEYRQKLLGACSSIKLSGWEPERVTQMCIFAGCDYLKSLSGMGVKKAHQAVSNCLRAPLDECYIKAIARLRLDGVSIPANFVEDFNRAYLTFQHQRVFDPILESVVPLKPLPTELVDSDTNYLGKPVPDDMARAIASGRVHPSTFEPFPEPKARAARSLTSSSSSSSSSAPAPRPTMQKSLSFPVQRPPHVGDAGGVATNGVSAAELDSAQDSLDSSAGDAAPDGQAVASRNALLDNGQHTATTGGDGRAVSNQHVGSSGNGRSAFASSGVRKGAGKTTQSTINSFMSELVCVSGNAKKDFKPPRQMLASNAGQQQEEKQSGLKRSLECEEDAGPTKERRLQTKNPYVQASPNPTPRNLTSRFFPSSAAKNTEDTATSDIHRGAEKLAAEDEADNGTVQHASLEDLRYKPRVDGRSSTQPPFRSSLLIPSPVQAGKRLSRMALPHRMQSQSARAASLDTLACFAHTRNTPGARHSL